MRIAKLVVTVVLFAHVAGCSSKGSGTDQGPAIDTKPTVDINTTPVSAPIGPQGGNVQTADSNVQVQVPPGALSQTTTITITPTTAPIPGAIGPAYEIGPTGTQFSKPITLVFRYNSVALGPIAPSRLVVATAIGGRWQALDATSLDAAHNTVSGQANHLSVFAMWVPATGDGGTGPNPDGCTNGCVIAGTCWPAAATDPANACQKCEPSSSPTAWTAVSKCVWTLAKFSAGVTGVAVDASGKVYVVTGNTIQVVSGGKISTLAGSGTAGFLDGPAASAMFSYPWGIAVNGSGSNVFVSDYNNGRIRLVSGGQVSTVAGDGSHGFVDGPAASAQFDQLQGLTVDGSGKVYVSDELNMRIRLVTGGQVSTAAGNGDQGFLDGAVTSAQFNHPWGVAVDSSGTKIYVGDSSNHRIRLVSAGQVSTLAGNGTQGSADGPAASAQFASPRGVAVDSSGKVYVADTGNERIRIVSGGQVTTLAGGAGPGFVDGPTAVAKFSPPQSVAVDSSGKVYVGEIANSCVRVINP